MMKRASTKSPADTDREIGLRLRWLRRKLKMTQANLADELHVSFQQIQKYENGVNRISAGRLYEIAAALGTPIEYFYEGFKDAFPIPSGSEPTNGLSQFPSMDATAYSLAVAFESIKDARYRKSFLRLVRLLGEKTKR